MKAGQSLTELISLLVRPGGSMCPSGWSLCSFQQLKVSAFGYLKILSVSGMLKWSMFSTWQRDIQNSMDPFYECPR